MSGESELVSLQNDLAKHKEAISEDQAAHDILAFIEKREEPLTRPQENEWAMAPAGGCCIVM